MLRRFAGMLLVASLLAISGCSTPQVSRSAQLFFSMEAAASSGIPPVDEQELTARSTEALSAAQHAGSIPDAVDVRLLPDTVVLEVTAYAESAQDAARMVDDAADELASRLNTAEDSLGRVVVVDYAVD